MILEFVQGTIKVIPGVGNSSITIHPDSSIELMADGSITISSKTVAVGAIPVHEFSKYNDPAYLKTLGPITAQGIATTGYVQTVPSPGGILMNNIADSNKFYTGAMVSALDAGEKVRTEKLDVRTRQRDELLAHSGGLEKVGKEVEALPMDYKAFAEAHGALAEHGGYGAAFPMWEDDPVAKLYKGTLEAPAYAEGKEDDEAGLEGRLNDYYASAVLSDKDDDMRLFHSLQYLLEVGEDIEALLEGFDDGDIGPASSYVFALVQEHRRQQEVERAEVLQVMVDDAEAILAKGDRLLELTWKLIEDPDNEELRAELDALYRDYMSDAGDEVLEPFEEGEPELECSGYYDEDKASDCNINFDAAMKALRASVHRNIAPTEKEYEEIPFAGAPLTEESVKSALDAIGFGRIGNAVMDEKHPIARGFWEGMNKIVYRGIEAAETFTDYAKRAGE